MKTFTLSALLTGFLSSGFTPSPLPPPIQQLAPHSTCRPHGPIHPIPLQTAPDKPLH